ncbi:hypothetical protein [Marinoscillum furvescens]|uniref:Uncharacterized protein n=1 Tax=Marinoscillum furvescens DSM 4134 TaxID=1122208 RepID=A0A3D9L508_MARFU|nr:hypothetical protein [Marinoscillum furvescens]REE01115.1 hypothetical protein C7460_104135 [Marinoscillum furvescens DSM 4134]
MNRKERRKVEKRAVREAHKIKQSKSFELVNAIKTLRDRGAIKINYSTYHVQLLRNLMWDSHDAQWQTNFTARLHAYLDGMTGKDPDAPDYKPLPLTITDLTSGELLITFSPES